MRLHRFWLSTLLGMAVMWPWHSLSCPSDTHPKARPHLVQIQARPNALASAALADNTGAAEPAPDKGFSRLLPGVPTALPQLETPHPESPLSEDGHSLFRLAPVQSGPPQPTPEKTSGTAAPLSVAVYNNGRALVSEVRTLDLPEGSGRVEFSGVPETIEPETLRVHSLTAPEQFRLLDMNYEYDLVTPEALLKRSVGKELTVILPDPDSQGRVTRQATLVADNGAPVFRLEDGSLWAGPYEAVQLPTLPQGLRPTPALVWLVDNAGPARQDLAVSYLARGLSWRTDYVLTLNRAGNRASLAGWVTLDNTCGMAFHNAALKLVAGNVHEAAPTLRANGAMLKVASSPAADMAEEGFFEYHLYSLARPVDIANHQRKQVALLQSPNLGVQRELVSRFSAFGPRRAPGPWRQDVEATLRFPNTAANGLGMALPQGIVRAYQPGSDGAILFIGEDRLEHTPEGREVRLVMGNAFDISVERILTGYRKIGKETTEFDYRITARNAKDEPVQLLLQELPPGEWTITASDRPFDRPWSGEARFTLDLPGKMQAPDNAATVTYTIRIKN